jgi:epoxyqueuosine reductase
MILSSEFLSSLGILEYGYTEDPSPQSLKHYQHWTDKGLHGPLSYLNDHRKDLRLDLRNVYPQFQSALVFLFDYRQAKKWMLENSRHEVAAYTLGFEGEDYHHALKKRLMVIEEFLKPSFPGLETFISLDVHPVLERDLALRAGLGWFGKNSMLIHQKHGSYFMIGSLLLNHKLPLPTSTMDVDHCGQCTACADACPTEAIDLSTRTLKASACISTFTIETFKDEDPPKGFEKSRGEIFGCDICQDVCPWNKKTLRHVIAKLDLKEQLSFFRQWFYEWPKEKLRTLIEEESNRGLKKKFLGTAFDRLGKVGWLKNLKASQNVSLKKKKGEE